MAKGRVNLTREKDKRLERQEAEAEHLKQEGVRGDQGGRGPYTIPSVPSGVVSETEFDCPDSLPAASKAETL